MKRMIPVLATLVFGMFGLLWIARAEEPCNPDKERTDWKVCNNKNAEQCKGKAKFGLCDPVNDMTQPNMTLQCVQMANTPTHHKCPAPHFKTYCKDAITGDVSVDHVEPFPLTFVCLFWALCEVSPDGSCDAADSQPLEVPFCINVCCPVPKPGELPK